MVRNCIDKKRILIEKFLEGGVYEMFNSNTEVVKVLSNYMADADGGIGLSVTQKENEEEDASDDEFYDRGRRIVIYHHTATSKIIGFPYCFVTFPSRSLSGLSLLCICKVIMKKDYGTRRVMLTDPAIHKKNRRWKEKLISVALTQEGNESRHSLNLILLYMYACMSVAGSAPEIDMRTL